MQSKIILNIIYIKAYSYIILILHIIYFIFLVFSSFSSHVTFQHSLTRSKIDYNRSTWYVSLSIAVFTCQNFNKKNSDNTTP